MLVKDRLLILTANSDLLRFDVKTNDQKPKPTDDEFFQMLREIVDLYKLGWKIKNYGLSSEEAQLRYFPKP